MFFNNCWLIRAAIDSKEMPTDVLESFDFVINEWGVDSKFSMYVGWTLSNLDFNKDSPDQIDLCKMSVDDWLIDYKNILDLEDAAVLIKCMN